MNVMVRHRHLLLLWAWLASGSVIAQNVEEAGLGEALGRGYSSLTRTWSASTVSPSLTFMSLTVPLQGL